MRWVVAVTMIAWAAQFSGAARADLYRWVDPATGSVKFSNYPPPWYGDPEKERRAPKVEVIPDRSSAPSSGPKPEDEAKPESRPAARPAEKSADRRVDRSADRPADRTAERPVDRTPDGPADKSMDRPSQKPAGRPEPAASKDGSADGR